PAEGVAEATELAEAAPVEPAPAEPAPAADLSAPEPEEAPAAMPPVAFAPLDLAPPAEEDVAVGDVRVPAPLFAIHVGEAEEHAASLDRELARIEADPLVPVSDAFMRAAHTLASSSRTTGFEPLAQVAAALEKWLTDAIELPPEFDARRLVLTRRAVDAVGAMVRAIGERTPPAAR